MGGLNLSLGSVFSPTMLTEGSSLDSYIPSQSMPTYSPSSKSSFGTPGNLAMMTQIMGGVNQAIGGYFQAQSQQYQYKSQAVSDQYQSDMAAINARNAQYQAHTDLRAGQSQVFNYTMQEGQQAADTTASMASRGLRLGSGTTQDVTASMDLAKQENVYSINSNAMQKANASRVQETNYQNQSNMANVSAANATRSADSISPFAAGFSSLLTSASGIANNWNNSKRMKMYLSNGGYMPMYGGGSF